jgi:hypothetical protein
MMAALRHRLRLPPPATCLPSPLAGEGQGGGKAAAAPADPTPFARLAVTLLVAQRAEEHGLVALERLAHELDADKFARVVADVRRQAAELGEAYDLLRALIPHEAAVREIIAEAESEAA